MMTFLSKGVPCKKALVTSQISMPHPSLAATAVTIFVVSFAAVGESDWGLECSSTFYGCIRKDTY